MTRKEIHDLAKHHAVSLWVFSKAITYLNNADQSDRAKALETLTHELAELYANEVGAKRMADAMQAFGTGIIADMGFDEDQPAPTVQGTGSVQ